MQMPFSVAAGFVYSPLATGAGHVVTSGPGGAGRWNINANQRSVYALGPSSRSVGISVGASKAVYAQWEDGGVAIRNIAAFNLNSEPASMTVTGATRIGNAYLGEVMDVLVFDRILTTAEQTKLIQWMEARYD